MDWIGLTSDSWKKVLLTVLLLLGVAGATVSLRWCVSAIMPSGKFSRAKFWVRQSITLVCTTVLVLGLMSIWVAKPETLTTALGMATAGIAFALQRVLTAFAGYLVILRGKAFQVGDRISLGAVRGDVIDISFMQISILEMGQPRDEPNAAWVRGRQFTGRIVTVSTNRIFEDPVFNYTHDFPLLWDEVSIEFRFTENRRRIESTLLASARSHASPRKFLDERQLHDIERRFEVSASGLEPRVYFRILPNSLQATLRFVTPAHSDREITDDITREILDGLEREGIPIGIA